MKAIILARVSTEDQIKEGQSIPAQLSRARDYCQRKELVIKSEYQFDESSTKDQREKFEKVVQELRDSKEKVALIVETIDRLQRSFKESVLLDNLRKQDKVEIHFLRENLIISINSNSSDLLRWDMGVMFARSYVLQLSDNVKRSIEQKLKNGEWIGRAPFGYKNITRDSDGKKDIVIDEYQSKIVVKMFEWYSTGAFSILLVRQKLKNEYNIDFSKGYIDFILKNRFYYGEMVSKGKAYPHKYQVIISKELFDKVQAIKAGYNKKHFKFAGLPYVYRGLIRCAFCGSMITPEKHKGHIYYHCTQYKGKHNAEWLREEEITEQFASLFKKLHIPDNVLEEIISSLRSVHKGKSEFREAQYKKLTTEKDIYAKRIENMYLDKIDGRITADGYDKMYAGFRARIDEIDNKLSNLQRAEDDYYLTSEYVLKILNKAYELFIGSEIEEKRQLLKLILQNPTLDGRLVKYSLLKPFDVVLNYADNKLELPREDSNLEP